MPHKINDRGHVYGCSHRRFFFARGVKNESRHRCGFIVSISHGEKKPKTSSLANMRLQPQREEVIGNSSSQKESFEILLELLPSCFSVIVSLTGGRGWGGGFIQDFLFPKTSLLTEHNMISLASNAAVPSSLPRMKLRTCSQRDRTSCILPLWRNLKAAMNNLSIWEEST